MKYADDRFKSGPKLITGPMPGPGMRFLARFWYYTNHNSISKHGIRTLEVLFTG